MTQCAPQYQMRGAAPAPHGTLVCGTVEPERRLSNEAAQILRAHLKALYTVSPEGKRARVSDQLASETPHGPAKAPKLQLAFPKPCTRVPAVSAPQRSPHQASKAVYLPPQSKQARQGTTSTLRLVAPTASSQGCLGSPLDVRSATDRRVVTASAPTAADAQWAVHTPVSHAVYLHLKNSILHLKAAPVYASKSAESLNSSTTVRHTDWIRPHTLMGAPSHVCNVKIPPPAASLGINRVLAASERSQVFVPPISRQASCVPLIQPAPPRPRKKVWQYRPYSVHAPSNGHLDSTPTARRKRKRKPV